MLWLFSGTSDGNKIAQDLISKKCSLKVFVASQYGQKVAAEILPPQVIQTGRLSESDIFQQGELETPETVIDATHPYALEISQNLMQFCQARQVPYIRYERPEELVEGENIHIVNDIKQASEKAKVLGSQILLTVGSKNIEPFLTKEFHRKLFVRMLPDPALIQDLLLKGVTPDRIIAIQGPFSIEMNRAMMVDFCIDCLVTKSSGKEGGVPQKISAARELGASVIIIKRPEIKYPLLFSDRNEVVKHINNS